MYVGAAAKLAAAYRPKKESQKIIQKTQKTNGINLTAFNAKIKKIKANGYSITKGERVSGVIGIAAPIFKGDKNLWGGTLLTIPEVRYNQKQQNTIGKIVIGCANKIATCIK